MPIENNRLKKTINEIDYSSDEILAKVIVDKQSPFLKSIIINKGSKHNAKLGMAVLDDKYLVGKVVEVNFTTSRVLLISDLNSKIPVDIMPNEILSILSGTGQDHGRAWPLIQCLQPTEEALEVPLWCLRSQLSSG